MTQKVVTNDEAVTGSKKFFFAIFDTFGRYITNLRGTFVENVKKVENQPTLLYSASTDLKLIHKILFCVRVVNGYMNQFWLY
jgi:hypothetical protein